jgi:hypothetical protein
MKTFKNKLGLLGMICTAMLFVLVVSCKDDAQKASSDTNRVDITPVSEKMNKIPDTSAAVAKNPAHGQPGHRCDIPVGAPLNSPPATNSTSPIITNSGTPVNNSGNANPTVNPPHGQPGHRCDVKVGDPL